MNFETLATGSTGNLYSFDDGQTRIIIEAGLPYREMQKRLKYGLRDYAGVLVSHSHKDHAKAVGTIIERGGLDVYMTKGTHYEILGLKRHHRSKEITPGMSFRIGTLTVIPFSTIHDVVGGVGFAIKPDNDGVFVFATDTGTMKYVRIRNVKYLAIECNYQNDIIKGRYLNGYINESVYLRIMETHLGYEDVLEFVKSCEPDKIEWIELIHHSQSNCDIAECATQLEKATGIRTTYHG